MVLSAKNRVQCIPRKKVALPNLPLEQSVLCGGKIRITRFLYERKYQGWVVVQG